MDLSVLPGRFAICRLPPDREVPQWALGNRTFVSVTYTADELSIVCPDNSVPEDEKSETGWVAIKVQGPLDFSLTGILAALAAPLAESGISIFAISTYDTDYLMVKEGNLMPAKEVLEKKGHLIQG